jgi:hypothetical protein
MTHNLIPETKVGNFPCYRYEPIAKKINEMKSNR